MATIIGGIFPIAWMRMLAQLLLRLLANDVAINNQWILPIMNNISIGQPLSSIIHTELVGQSLASRWLLISSSVPLSKPM